MQRYSLALVLGLVAAAAAVADEESHIVRGRITDLRPAEQQLTVQPRKGEPVKLRLDDRSQVQLGKGVGKLDQLKLGMRVRVSYTTKDGVNHVVTLRDPLLTLDKAQRVVNGALDVARAYGFQKRDEYRQKLQGLVKELDERIEELQERAADAAPEVRRGYEKELEQMRRERQVLRDRIARVDTATADSWQDVQAGINAAINDLERTIERVRGNFVPPPPAR